MNPYCCNCDPRKQTRESLSDFVERKAREALGSGQTGEALGLLDRLVAIKRFERGD